MIEAIIFNDNCPLRNNDADFIFYSWRPGMFNSKKYPMLKDHENIIELREDFNVIYLNRTNIINGICSHTIGTIFQTVVDVKTIIGRAALGIPWFLAMVANEYLATYVVEFSSTLASLASSFNRLFCLPLAHSISL
ncbi:MAG: hypothetical protein ACI81Y_000846 [Glaciecola sp.]